MRIVSIDHQKQWDEIVKSFEGWDIYYLNAYARSLMLHGDGVPALLFFECDQCRISYVVMINDIAQSPYFVGRLEQNIYFDMETPYGYGGPLVEGSFNDATKYAFLQELSVFCLANGIVSQFIRFHPILHNNLFFEGISDISTRQNTVYMDTASETIIWQNMDTKNRNMIRKAEKAGIHIICDKGENIDSFMKVYNATMERLGATKYYTFQASYYSMLIKAMQENVVFFYALLDNMVIASSMFFYNERYMHYHLSGSDCEYRRFAPSNLLLYKAALWAEKKGIKGLHLGGGVGTDDSLFGFKKQFNKNGVLPFYIGRNIFDTEKYSVLMNVRAANDENFDLNNSYLIQYRR